MTEPSLSDLPAVSYLDPASCRPASELKRGACRSALVVLKYDEMLRKYPVMAWAARCSVEELAEQVFVANEEYHPRPFGIEGAFMQNLFAHSLGLLHRECLAKGYFTRSDGTRLEITKPLLIRSVDLPRGIDKKPRIRTGLQPELKAGKVIFQKVRDEITGRERWAHPELMKEIRDGLGGRTVDLLDALNEACKLVPKKATEADRRRREEDLVRKLRAEGLPPEVVKQAVVSRAHIRRDVDWRKPPEVPTHHPDGTRLDPFERKIAERRARRFGK